MQIKTRHWDRLGNGGLSLTELGFGTAPLGNLYRAISEAEAQASLQQAWDVGVRYIDTAPLYGFGLSETRINHFLRERPRQDYMLSTKVGRLLTPATKDTRDGGGKWFNVPARREVYDYSYDGVMRSFEASLERLGIDRVDMLFAHDLDVINHGSQDALDEKLTEFMAGGYRALLELRDQKVIQAFGAGVNEWEPCQWMAERGDFDIFLLAGRYTLLEQPALESFLPLCETRKIGVVIGGPYNSGILATGARKGAYYNYEIAPENILAKVARLEAICKSHNVRLLDAALQFTLAHPVVVSVIPGGQSEAEMRSNLQAYQANIPADLWAELKFEGVLDEKAPTP